MASLVQDAAPLWAVLLVCTVAGAVAADSMWPPLARNPLFVAPVSAACAQLCVLLWPRVLYVQFQRRVTWEDIAHDSFVKRAFLGVSDVITVTGVTVCVTVLVGRYHAGDLLSMQTVAEIAGTLYMAQRAQRLLGGPALALGRYHARVRERRARRDVQERPFFSDAGMLVTPVGTEPDGLVRVG